MQGPNLETIFANLFKLVSTVQGADWSGTPIPLVYSTRNWKPPQIASQGQMPSLYQLDPFKPEKDFATGRGRRRRVLQALIDIYFQVNTGTPDTQPYNTIFNNWTQNLYNLLSPQDDPGLVLGVPNQITDFGPVEWQYAYGFKDGVGLVSCRVEIETGG